MSVCYLVAPRAVDIVADVRLQCGLCHLVATVKEELGIFASDERNGHLSVARIVQDKYEVIPWTFGSFAWDTEMSGVIRAFVLDLLDRLTRWRHYPRLLDVLGRRTRESDQSGRSIVFVHH